MQLLLNKDEALAVIPMLSDRIEQLRHLLREVGRAAQSTPFCFARRPLELYISTPQVPHT